MEDTDQNQSLNRPETQLPLTPKTNSLYQEATTNTLNPAPTDTTPQNQTISTLPISASKIVSGLLQSNNGKTFFNLDEDYILINDDTTNRLLLGKNPSTNVTEMKLSQSGVDVLTGTDDQMIWSSSFNMFKIAKEFLATYTFTATDFSNGYANTSFAHNLGYKPNVTATVSVDSDNTVRFLPFIWIGYAGGSPVIGATITLDSVDDTNLYIKITILNVLGGSYLLSNSVLSFKFYCMRETTVS